MKQMEFNLKVTTDGPTSDMALKDALREVPGVVSIEVTSYRVKPTPRTPAKPAKVAVGS